MLRSDDWCRCHTAFIADVATAAAPATATAFPALGPIEVFAASSARLFPAFSSTALPPTSVKLEQSLRPLLSPLV
jgi:hypothetical protein